MTETNIRISKILKEFNIGLQTLIEFLTKKGIEVESNPNAKISDDAYGLVKNAFGADRDLKNEAKDVLPQKKKSADSPTQDEKPEKEPEELPEEKEIIIKDTTTEKPVLHPLKKSVISGFYSQNQKLFISNISHKFRSGKQFNTHEIYYLLMFEAGKSIRKSASEHLLYMKPVNRGGKYLSRKLRTFENNESLKFCCIGSLDLATETDCTTLFDWLGKILSIKL